MLNKVLSWFRVFWEKILNILRETDHYNGNRTSCCKARAPKQTILNRWGIAVSSNVLNSHLECVKNNTWTCQKRWSVYLWLYLEGFSLCTSTIWGICHISEYIWINISWTTIIKITSKSLAILGSLCPGGLVSRLMIWKNIFILSMHKKMIKCDYISKGPGVILARP